LTSIRWFRLTPASRSRMPSESTTPAKSSAMQPIPATLPALSCWVRN